MLSKRVLHVVAVVCALVSAGCGSAASGAGDKQKVYKVRGKITMSGAPVASAMVSFSPKGKQPVATGRTGIDGTYALTTYDANDGAAEGDYVVLVTKAAASKAASATIGGHDPDKPFDASAMHNAQGPAESGGDTGSLLPEKYSRPDQSDLPAKVEPKSENELNFDLKP